MDPLSVSASIVGILAAAAKTSSVLANFVQNARHAPTTAHSILREINGLRTVLNSLQGYVLGSRTIAQPRAALILVEQVVVTLVECVSIFSELEYLFGTTVEVTAVSTIERMKLAFRSSKITSLQMRLEKTKSSLTLILTVLQCEVMSEAETAVDRLFVLVQQVLSSNQEMSARLHAMDQRITNDDSVTVAVEDDNVTQSLTRSVTSQSTPELEDVQLRQFSLPLEEDLRKSKVYKKAAFNNSERTLMSATAFSTAKSILSAYSLSEISNISVFALPIYSNEVGNSFRYIFGVPTAAGTSILPSLGTHVSNAGHQVENSAISGPLDKLIAETPNSRTTLSDMSDEMYKGVRSVFGVSLSTSIEYASTAITLTYRDASDAEIRHGRIPIIVAKLGEYLMDEGLNAAGIFRHDTSSEGPRIQGLAKRFNAGPEFGRFIPESYLEPHIAASLLSEFLWTLPEPIIPQHCYDYFRRPSVYPYPATYLDLKVDIEDGFMLENYRQKVHALPIDSRHTLLYLLKLFAHLLLKSIWNGLNIEHLTSLFQPVILRPTSGYPDVSMETPIERLRNQKVLIYLIKKQHLLTRHEFKPGWQPVKDLRNSNS
ncbi:uncharacterized protein KY384_004591 [Bacidia gigantensis]|uniref:uncharacterized protein n=1 Tax=Bacidia gigantensis TaxID=2732470 RepID=UPI001D053790|nr:uncharacterized protein KY384_004591 [Bacidia gigantensis]KAG8531233.1 hypothetical protein KY384_004591 [Bacidia gigantensis]